MPAEVNGSAGPPAPAGIDKSALAFAELRRLRSKAHLRSVAQQPCLICGRTPSQAHHLRFAHPRGVSLKVSDEFAVPLCAIHHTEIHHMAMSSAGGASTRSIRFRWLPGCGVKAEPVRPQPISSGSRPKRAKALWP